VGHERFVLSQGIHAETLSHVGIQIDFHLFSSSSGCKRRPFGNSNFSAS
jgi:hypothetical protein